MTAEIRCVACDELIERPQAAWRKVEGWEKQRAQGGTNHVALREPLDVFMCNGCMILKQSKITPGQLTF